MKDTELFQTALGLIPPWQVESSEFNPATERLDIIIDFPCGGTSACPECEEKDLKGFLNNYCDKITVHQ